jgi:hypothetical protein
MVCFGGIITTVSSQVYDNTTPALYYLLNFNDFGASLVTLFHIMVVNNWYVTCNMYCYVVGNNWPRMYFILFWALTVLIMLNLVIAFIIEIYDTVSQEIEVEYKRREFVLKL